MKTGGHLKIEKMGSEVLGVRLFGDKNKPEPPYFRVVFPFGDIDISRCSDGCYWVHIRRNTADDVIASDTRVEGKIIDGRVDVEGKHASETSCGDLDNENAYHTAIKFGPVIAGRKGE
jgi:hypothetical protein